MNTNDSAPPLTVEAAQVLDRAARFIDRHGLAKLTLAGDGLDPQPVGGDAPHCSLGAIYAVTRGHHDGPPRALAIDAVTAHATRGTDLWSLAAWNDAPGRTADQVTDAMRAVAAELRSKATA